MANLIRFWVGAGESKISLTPHNTQDLQGQPLFFEVPAESLKLPVRAKNGKVTMQDQILREWVFGLLKPNGVDKTHQTWVDIDSAVIEQKFRKSDSRPYRSLDLTRDDMGAVLAGFVKQVWDNRTEKVARGAASAAEANGLIEGMEFE